MMKKMMILMKIKVRFNATMPSLHPFGLFSMPQPFGMLLTTALFTVSVYSVTTISRDSPVLYLITGTHVETVPEST
jgi:hypothetical protein